MRGSHLLVIASALSLACTDGPTSTPEAPPPTFVTRNFTEDNAHTWVGLLVVYDENGEFLGRCSGSLISPTTFLTAGHCVEGASSARIWFAQDAGANFDPETGFDPVTGYPETCLPQPAPCVTSDEFYHYGEFTGFPVRDDLAVVVLDEPVTTVGLGELAAAGTLNSLATQRGLQDVTFVVSGYGISRVRPTTLSFRERLMAETKLINLNNTVGFYAHTSNSPGNGRGGVCFGDSGGPLLYQGEIVGVASRVFNGNCGGGNLFYRVDRAEVLAWIADPS